MTEPVRYHRVAQLVFGQPLLATTSAAEAVGAYLASRIDGADFEANRFLGENQADPQTGRWKGFRTIGNVAVISIMGELVNRGAWMGAASGLTSYEGIVEQVRQAASDPQVNSIVLDIGSPGGEAWGCFDAARQIRAYAGDRRLIAVANPYAASAAYAIAAVCDEIVVNEGGLVGSVGVVTVHMDRSEQLKASGVKASVISTGWKKTVGSSSVPLDDRGAALLAERANRLMDGFAALLTEFRPQLTVEAIRALEGDYLIGSDAVAAGLADRVGTFESVLADLSRANGRNPSMKGNTSMEKTTEAGQTTAAETTTPAPAAAAPVDLQAAIAAERTRMAGLDTLASKLNGQADGLKIIAAAKLDGSSAGDAALKLFSEGVVDKIVALGGLKIDDATAAGAVPAAAADATETAQATTPEGWKAEWEKSASLQAEFATSAQYVAFKRAEAGGRVRVMGAKK